MILLWDTNNMSDEGWLALGLFIGSLMIPILSVPLWFISTFFYFIVRQGVFKKILKVISVISAVLSLIGCIAWLFLGSR